MYDVLAELEEDFLAQIRSCVDQIDERGSGRTAEPVYRLMRHIRDNADAYSLLLDNSIDEHFSFSIIRQALEFVKGQGDGNGLRTERRQPVRVYYGRQRRRHPQLDGGGDASARRSRS